MATGKRIVGLSSFGKRVDYLKSCRRLEEVRSVCFDHCKAGLVKIWGVCFDHRKAFRKLIELWRVHFKHRKVRGRLVLLWRVRFDHPTECRRLAQD